MGGIKEVFLSDDPALDFAMYDSEQERILERLPQCEKCGKPIRYDYYFEIDDCIICEDCLNRDHRKRVDDFIL